jgi:AcrR family transcriptional regulator/DNA-binding MarR family transcriptional regulator
MASASAPPRRGARGLADRSEVSAVASPGRGGGPRRGVERRRAHGDVDRGGGRGGVAEIQRARMIAALVAVAGERGVGGVTVGRIVGRSGVSRRTFYELFEDREDCFLAAFDLAIELGAQRVVPAFRAPGSWRERVRAGLEALLGYLDDEPGLGALCVVDALGGGPVALERRARVVSALIDAVHDGRREAKGSAKPTRLTAEGVVGAVLSVLHARLSVGDARHNGGPAPMANLLGPLMAMIVLPYLGQAAASREAARAVPRRKRAVPLVSGDPLRELDMRLTYRTVRVLLAIAADPGASNRRVSEAADVSDQGQISKLLARLEHLGLIENDGAGPLRGEPNVWRLTPKGAEIERAIRRQATPVES